VESGTEEADFTPAAKFVPKIDTREPGETACPLAKLAPLTTPPFEMTGVCASIETARKVKRMVDEKKPVMTHPASFPRKLLPKPSLALF
jgi:hypothetical protein